MKKKVAFFIKSLNIGGTERVLIAYLKGLVKLNKYDIKLIIGRNNNNNILLDNVPKEVEIKYIFTKEQDIFLEKTYENRKKNILYKIVDNIVMPLSKKYREKKVREIVLESKIDILVDFERSFVKCAENIKCKKIIWNHFTFDKIDEKNIKRWNSYFDKYNLIIAISNEMKSEIESFYLNVKKIHMLYNPQDFDKILSLSRSEEELSTEEIELINDKYIVYVGRIEKIKGLEDLIESYKAINRDIKEKLYIIGTGRELVRLKEIVKNYNLDDKIKFLGNKKNPYIWMKNAKLFVTTTYGEGLPTTYIESMICGTPVLSYDSPTGPKDILGMGKYGALVKKGEKEEFAIELKNLLQNPEIIDRYRVDMKEKLNEFKIEKIISEFDKILESV